MDDSQLERYSRQLLLNEVDLDGQERLANSAIMIVGLGGLGNIALSALAGAGVGTLHIWDGDQVETSNLPRQPLYDSADVGIAKTVAAKAHIVRKNPHIVVHTYSQLNDVQQGLDVAAECDLILDCTDNIATRRIVNQVAVTSGTPLIAGAAISFEGQLMTFLNQSGPCYECLTAQMAIKDVACRDVGILNTQVLMIGTLQAHTAIKHIVGIQPLVDGKLLIMDGKQDQFQTFAITKSANCHVCG